MVDKQFSDNEVVGVEPSEADVVTKTKNDTRARWWMATVPADDMSREMLEEVLRDYSVLGQMEEGGETGYRHWQLVLRGYSPIRFSTLKNKLPRANLSMVRSIPAAVKYVQKKDTRVDGVDPLKWGEDLTKKGQGKRTDLAEIREAILEHDATFNEVILNFPAAAQYSQMVRTLIAERDKQTYGKTERDLRVRVIFGEAGSGKSRYVADHYGYESTFWVTDYSHPFDGYDGEEVLILEEFAGQIRSDFMLKLLDRYPLELPARYSNRVACFSELVIISNLPPADWYTVDEFNRSRASRSSILPAHVDALARRIHLVEEMLVGCLHDCTESELAAFRRRGQDAKQSIAIMKQRAS